jgi:hypothetical protein
VHKAIISAVQRVESVSDRMSYNILRGCWCHIIVLNVHAPTEDKTDDVKDSFHEELEHTFHKFPKYHMKIILGNFNETGREDIFKPMIGNKRLHKLVMTMVLRAVNFATSKNHTVKVKCSHIATQMNTLGHLQM